MLSSLVVKSGETTLVKDTDYTASFNNSGNLEIRIKSKSKVMTLKTATAARLTLAPKATPII